MRLHSSVKLFDEPVNSLHFQPSTGVRGRVSRAPIEEIPLKHVGWERKIREFRLLRHLF